MEMHAFMQGIALQNKIEENRKLRQAIKEGKLVFQTPSGPATFVARDLPPKYSEMTRLYIEGLITQIDLEIEEDLLKFKNL